MRDLGFSYRHYQRIEAGEKDLRLSTLNRLANAFQLPPAASHVPGTRPTLPLCVSKDNKVRPYTPLQGAGEYHSEGNSSRDDAQTSIRSKGNGTHLGLYSSQDNVHFTVLPYVYAEL